MMVVNIPFAIAWFMMYQASHVSHLFIANSLLGLSVGLMEAPVMRQNKSALFTVKSALFLNEYSFYLLLLMKDNDVSGRDK